MKLTGEKSSVLNGYVPNGKGVCALYLCDFIDIEGHRSFYQVSELSA